MKAAYAFGGCLGWMVIALSTALSQTIFARIHFQLSSQLIREHSLLFAVGLPALSLMAILMWIPLPEHLLGFSMLDHYLGAAARSGIMAVGYVMGGESGGWTAFGVAVVLDRLSMWQRTVPAIARSKEEARSNIAILRRDISRDLVLAAPVLIAFRLGSSAGIVQIPDYTNPGNLLDLLMNSYWTVGAIYIGYRTWAMTIG